MKRSATFIPTSNEMFSKVEDESLQMLLRGGFIRENSEGIYTLLPLGKRIISKLEKALSNELEQLHAMEVSFPTLQIKKDVNEQTFQIENSPYFLVSNHFQTIFSLIQEEMPFSATFPFIFYQNEKVFCNDHRSKGLFHTKEYLLNEVYTFHDDEENLKQTYDKLLTIYTTLLSKLGLNYRIVKGNFKNNEQDVEEIIVLCEFGEETIAYSDQSNYCANINVAQVQAGTKLEQLIEMKPLQKMTLENIKSIDDIVQHKSISKKDCIQSTLYIVDEMYYIVLTRGDHEVNEMKLKQILNAENIQLANEEQIKEILNCSKGYVGPIKLPLEVKVIADNSVQEMVNVISGSNEDGIYYENVNPNRDFAVNQYEDIRFVQEGDLSPDGEGTIHFQKGMKVGYTLKLNLTDQLEKPMFASCYYFGITRLFAIIAESFHDANGFYWPKEIAPFQIYLVVKNNNDHAQRNLADELYNILSFYRFDVLFDDRNEKPETKFVDADLIGLPIRVTIGEKAQEGIIDVKIRNNSQTFQFAKEELIDWLTEYFRVE